MVKHGILEKLNYFCSHKSLLLLWAGYCMEIIP